jgi:hypothetical protein
MNFRIEFGEENLTREKWDAFLSGHPGNTVFQSWIMHRFYSSIPNARPILITSVDDSGHLLGILLGIWMFGPRRTPGFLSSRVIIYGGPLIRQDLADSDRILDDILKELVMRTRKHTSFIQFRNFSDLRSHEAVFRKHGFIFQDHLNLVLDTGDGMSPAEGLSKSRIRQVRKSIEAGATVEPASSLSEIRELYRILSGLYRKKVRKPLPPLSFFEEFYSFTKRNELGVVLVVKFSGKVIGGMFCPVTPGKKMYEWYVCGLDKEYRQLFPSVLVTYSALRYAAGHSIPHFDFMGLGKPGKIYGVREFKERFGGTPVNNGRYVRIHNKLFYRLAEESYRILSLLRII